MRHLVSSEVTKARIANWLLSAQPVEDKVSWTETRLAIVFGGYTYLIEKEQIFQCAHCGYYDPQWSSTEVLKFFEETFGIKPTEIQVTVTVELPE